MSDYFEWNEAKLGLHVPAMDREHQVLISLMNKLHVLREKQASSGEVLAAINALGEYTVKHFADEEMYMARIQYPGIGVHKAVHKQATRAQVAQASNRSSTSALHHVGFD